MHWINTAIAASNPAVASVALRGTLAATGVVLGVLMALGAPRDASAQASDIVSRNSASCVITTAGALRCWGASALGLGTGSTAAEVRTPTDVIGATTGASKVTTTGETTCVIGTDATVKCRGTNGFLLAQGMFIGPASTTFLPVEALAGATQASFGYGSGFDYHACAVTRAGGVQCWGENGFRQLGNNTVSDTATPTDVIGLASGVAEVHSGLRFSCARLSGGTVKCWGRNQLGQLGNGTTNDSGVPVDVAGLTGVTQLSVGEAYACAVHGAGQVSCWGQNELGQLGDGTTAARNSPVAMAGVNDAASVAAGANHTCVVTTAGAAKCLGFNANGQLGDSTTTLRSALVNVSGLGSGVAKLSLGGNHTCALLANGGVKCWGSNAGGRLGNNSTNNGNFLIPVDVAGLAADNRPTQTVSFPVVSNARVNFVQGGTFALAATASSGQAIVFTSSTTSRCTVSGSTVTMVSAGTCTIVANQAGSTSFQAASATQNILLVPQFTTPTTARSVFLGLESSCALTGAGGLKCWGENILLSGTNTTLGIGASTGVIPQPADVAGMTSGYIAASSVGAFQCALTANGQVQCRGSSNAGQSGTGSTAVFVPLSTVPGLVGAKAVSSSSQHSCAITATDGVVCWGISTAYELGTNSQNISTTPIAPIGISSGIRSISAGWRYSCAVTTSGTVKCWGTQSARFGGRSELRTPTDIAGLTDIAMVSSGEATACAVTAGGAVKCWGGNDNLLFNDPQLNNAQFRTTPVDVPGLTSGVQSISVASGHACALMTTGAVKCWGSNSDGQLGIAVGTTITGLIDVPGLSSGAIGVAAFGRHSCAQMATGALKCWGKNVNGQLGDGTRTTRIGPVDVLLAAAGGVPQTITFASTVPTTIPYEPTYGGLAIATASSGLAPTFTSLTTSVCTVSGTVVTLLTVGTCTLRAAQAGDSTFAAAPTVDRSITITKGQSFITSFTVPTDRAFVANATATLSAQASSGLTVTFTSLTPSVCSVSGTIVTMLTAGVCTVRASQAGNALYDPAVTQDKSFVLSASGTAATTTTLVSSRDNPASGQAFTLTATVSSTTAGAFTGTYQFAEVTAAGNTVLCDRVTLSGNYATCAVPAANRSAGNRIYTATYSGDTRYAASIGSVSSQVQATSMAMTVTAFPTAPTAGQRTTLTAQLTLPTAVASPGSVVFTRGTTTLCTSAATALPGDAKSVVATCVINSVAAGANTIIGTYVNDATNGGITASLSFTAAAAGPLDYSDLWWAGQSENGWGLTVTQKGATQFNAFYVYANDGRPVWYVMPGGTWSNNFTVYSGALYAPTSAPLENYDSARFAVGASPGTATITYTSASTARFEYTINGVTATKNIVRQPFGVADANARIVTNDLWWGGTGQNGWGFALAQQERTLFGVWFTYASDGRGTWLVMPGCTWTGMTCTGDLYSTANLGGWLGVTYDANRVTVNRVGSVSLAFSDPDNAMLTYTVNGVTQAKPISRQPF